MAVHLRSSAVEGQTEETFVNQQLKLHLALNRRKGWMVDARPHSFPKVVTPFEYPISVSVMSQKVIILTIFSSE